MNLLRIAGLLFLVSALLAFPARAEEVEVIQDNGDSANRIDLVVMGDGYRAEDQTKLTQDTNSFLSTFWGESPLGEYRSYFNVKLIHVISVDNGADNGSYGADRDTALGAYYNCYNIDRLLCVNTGAVFQMAAANTPNYDYLMVIVNDPKYGGAGGSVATFSVHSSAGQIAVHEFGHMFANLADEYESAYPGYPDCGSDCPEPNATNHTQRQDIKWNLWIDAQTPVPTPETSTYQSQVGLFEGARYYSSGVFRPRQNCTMRSLGAPFGEVCQEALIKDVYNEVSAIDSTSPAQQIDLEGCQSVTLSLTGPRPDPDTMVYTWRVDGQVEQVGPESLVVEAALLGDGVHQVVVEAADQTLMVRNDPGDLLRDSYTWQVTVSDVGQGACMIGPDCIPAGQSSPGNPCLVCRPEIDPAGWTEADSEPCSDGQFCNGLESCQGSVCTAAEPVCADDGLVCTTTCAEGLQACNVTQAGMCAIDGVCHLAGESFADNPCLVCSPELDQLTWSPAEGVSCSDELFCNGLETCSAGVCGAPAEPCLDDGLSCTTTCDEDSQSCNVLQEGFCLIQGVCYPAQAAAPDNPCMQCLPETSSTAWSSAEGLSCSDGVYCNGPEVCQGGVCQPGDEPCQEDGIECTVTCTEAGQECNLPRAGTCLVDGDCVAQGSSPAHNVCLICQPEQAVHGYSPVGDGLGCDDDQPCTEGDSCRAGECIGTLIELCCVDDGDQCSDGDPCTGEDQCAEGVCQPGEKLCTADCPCEQDDKVSGGCSCGSGTSGQSLLFMLFSVVGLWSWRRRSYLSQ